MSKDKVLNSKCSQGEGVVSKRFRERNWERKSRMSLGKRYSTNERVGSIESKYIKKNKNKSKTKLFP